MKKIIVGIIIVVVLIAGGMYFMNSGKKVAPVEEEDIPKPTVALPTVTDSVQVDLKAKSGNQAVVLSISDIPAQTQSVEYEITYTTAAGLPRGVLGKIQLNGENKVTRDDIVLGTCSSGKCVYDTGVKEVRLTLRFNAAGGASVFQRTYPLE